MLFAAALILILVTSFFCSLSEASLLSLSRARVESLATKSASGKLLRRMKANLERPIAAILILNTVANTGGAAFVGSEYERLFGGANLGLFTLFLTIAVLIFSEFLPKSLGVRHAERSALVLARPLEFIFWLLTPLTALFERASHFLGPSSARHVSLEDLRATARMAASAKVLGKEELAIIDAASRLPRIAVSQIMIHRHDIVYLSLDEDFEVNLVRARQSQHSRLPLVRRDLDDLVGIVSMKAVLWQLAEEEEDLDDDAFYRMVGEQMRDPIFVAPELDVSQLIRTLARHHGHMAIVRDQHERVLGIVTIEDVVEELMGEIDDEFDRSPGVIENLGPGSWRFGGGAAWGDVRASLGLPNVELEETDLDGRLDMHDLASRHLRGRLRTGAHFQLGRWVFKVTRMRRGKVLYAEASLSDSKAAKPERAAAPSSGGLSGEIGRA